MQYSKKQLIERSGLGDRTIVRYIQLGILPKPNGIGTGATYTDEHMLRVVTIGRLRAQGESLSTITARIEGWNTAAFRRFVRQTDPPAAKPSTPAQPPPPPPAPAPATTGSPPETAGSLDVDGEPVPPGGRRLETRHEPIADLALPDGPSFRVVPLLPGLGLMVDLHAPAVVHRIAAEICDRYGRR